MTYEEKEKFRQRRKSEQKKRSRYNRQESAERVKAKKYSDDTWEEMLQKYKKIKIEDFNFDV